MNLIRHVRQGILPSKAVIIPGASHSNLDRRRLAVRSLADGCPVCVERGTGQTAARGGLSDCRSYPSTAVASDGSVADLHSDHRRI